MTESETGNPPPLLLYVWVDPLFEVTTTAKDDMDVATGKFELKE